MYRQISLASPSTQPKSKDLVVAIFEKAKTLPKPYATINRETAGTLQDTLNRPEFSAERGRVTVAYPPASRAKNRVGRLIILGLGTRDAFNADAIRAAATRLVAVAHQAGVQQLTLAIEPGLESLIDPEEAGRALADGLEIGGFDFNDYQGAVTKPDRNAPSTPTTLKLAAQGPFRQGLKTGLTIGQGVTLARHIAATPPNVAGPKHIAARCKQLARNTTLKCSIIDAKKAAQLKMGGLLAVGQAGSDPPALIVLEHKPTHAKNPPVLLVGKGVTFDTGGYSLKPAASMLGMKYDKCGAAAVIGTMHAVAQLKLPIHVVALVPVAENMVDRDAYRPGDIVTMANGVTVEVTNTDAEGRLILADALVYGHRKYKPQAVIDIATLTGGVVVALGSGCAGIFCEDSVLNHHMSRAGQDSGEKVWQLPLWPEHRNLLKGTHSDIVNSGSREAHAIQGATFLSYFVDPDSPKQLPKTPWAHLDIAGVGDVKDGHPTYPKGPTGFGVRLLVRTLETWPNRKQSKR